LTLVPATPPIRICFVCAGNICRSPTAEAIMKALVAEAGLSERIEVDSAGASGLTGGALPDRRSTAVAAERGVALVGRSRPFQSIDFEVFDYVVAMDERNRSDLLDLASGAEDRARISLMRDHDPSAPANASVPDPYLGAGGFDRVYDICESACRGMLASLVDEHRLG
jgi:protein-tyrosine phosphatase